MASKVSKSDFKVLKVTKREPLKKLLERSKIKFEKGKAYYQLTKGEVIQDYKKLIVRRDKDGSLVTGAGVREILKIPKSSISKFKLDEDEVTDFTVFVQSTSHNRVVLPDTQLLYRIKDEVDEEEEEEEEDVKPTRGRRGRAAAKAKAKVDNEDEEEEEEVKPTRGRRGTRAASKAATKTTAATKKTTKKASAGKRKAAAAAAKDDDDDDEVDEEPETKKKATSKKAPPPQASAPGPGSPIDVAFSFDTTGSMYACLGEVRRRVQETIARMFRDIPGLRVAVIAHGDYCDENYYYVTKMEDFTTDQNKLCNFVRNVGATGGGDFDECYELVLRQAHSELTWREGSQRSLVMIGDATPHPPNYPLNKMKLDWGRECDTLKENGIRIYSVQCLNRPMSTNFYRDLARLTDGFHLQMDQFASIVNFMLAICYREQGNYQLQTFEDEVRGGRGMNRELHRLFDNLQGRTTAFKATGGTAGAATGPRPDGLVPVDPARFQVLSVDSRCSIKDFVQRNSLIFKAGRGFYEFTKPETVSAKKEVVLVDKITGDMFTGKEACDMIGAGGMGKIRPASLDKFRVFVQSTSYNRVLVEDTGFLYEVDTDH